MDSSPPGGSSDEFKALIATEIGNGNEPRSEPITRLRNSLAAAALVAARLYEAIVARIDRRAVAERDGLVVGVEAGVNLPLVGRADLGECGARGSRAEADKSQQISGCAAVAGEVEDRVAV